MYVKENVTLKMGGKSYIELSVLLTSIEFITMKNFLIREKLDKSKFIVFLLWVCLFVCLFYLHLHYLEVLGQGWNLRHSSNSSCCNDNAGFLTCCVTREVRIHHFKKEISQSGFIQKLFKKCDSKLWVRSKDWT